MYIYGIMVDDDVIYVGKTTRKLEKRFGEHLLCMKQEKEGTYQGTQNNLYGYMNWAKERGKNVHMVVLLDTSDILCEREITDELLQTMELGFISYFKQTGQLKNIEGVDKPYKWR